MKRKSLARSLIAVFVAVNLLSGCSAFSRRRPSARGDMGVPDEIVQHFLSHPHFTALKTEPSDLRWLVYTEEEARTVVGATFKAKDRLGNDKEWYYLMAFEPGAKGEAPKELYGALASIDDPDFDASSFSVREVDMPSGEKKLLLIATGIAGDPEVRKVVLETSEGRTLEAKMYGQFYLVAEEAVSRSEKVLKTTGHSSGATQLYQNPPFVIAQGVPPVREPSDIPNYVLNHFYDRIPWATDVEWRVCVEEDGEVITGATYTGLSKTGPIDCFFLGIYSTSGKPLRGASGAIENSGITTLLDAFGADYEEAHLPWIGYVPDERAVRVVCETSKGRSIEATMYGPFWIAYMDVLAAEDRVTYFVAYDPEGVELCRVKR
jgi:hypothetical protein